MHIYWTQSWSSNDMDNLVNVLEFIAVGKDQSRQCISIPMGTDCAPLLANLSFFHMNTRI